jgi:hypothetical protein
MERKSKAREAGGTSFCALQIGFKKTLPLSHGLNRIRQSLLYD